MLKKCTYNSQYVAHYAQVELTIMLTKTDMRHIMRQSYTIVECGHFSFVMCSGSKVGTSSLINPLPVHNM